MAGFSFKDVALRVCHSNGQRCEGREECWAILTPHILDQASRLSNVD